MSNDGYNRTTRCDFCRLPCPEPTLSLDRSGVSYEFCSEACRDALRDSDRVFTEYHGHRRVSPGVSGLDTALPEGMPRNSFVLIRGQAGTRDTELHAELVWRTLQRGEPAVIVSFREPPTSVVERFLTLDWNVLPSLERGQLRIVDCFTDRLDNPDRLFDRMNDWNRHLHGVTEPASIDVRNPRDTAEIESKLDDALDESGMVDEGIVVIDSLTEFGTLVQPVQAYDFVKNVRADVCKGRFVPIFAGATPGPERDVFPHDLEYIADGIVDLAMDDSLVEHTLIKRIRIRKMSGVLVYAEWVAYEYTAEQGMVTFSPAEEMNGDDETSSTEPDGSASTEDTDGDVSES